MEIQVCEDYETLSAAAAQLVYAALQERPELLLGVATGATPTRAYEILASSVREKPSIARELRLVTIDEWGGLAAGDPATCDSYARARVVGPLGVDEGRYTSFVSRPEDPEREAWRMRQWLARNGPIDLCILGLGTNGHVALVEPAPELVRGTHVAVLSDASLHHTMLSEAASAPTFGLTLGIDDLLASRQVLLLVSGDGKRAQLARLLEGPISTRFPGSLLWLHQNATLLFDRAAAGEPAAENTARHE